MAGYYWYGNKRKGPGRPPKWVENILTDADQDSTKESADRSLAETELENESSVGPHTTANDLEDLESRAQEQETTSCRKRSGRYSLRERVCPPDRLHPV